MTSSAHLNSTTFELLHPKQAPLAFPRDITLAVVCSGNFGSGKTSLLSGILASLQGIRMPECAIVSNDLATAGGTTVDYERFRQLGEIRHDRVAACACCDAKSEFVARVANLIAPARPPAGSITLKSITLPKLGATSPKSPDRGALLDVSRRFVVIEVGGQTNGGQAAAALSDKFSGRKDVRLVHVTIIDADRFKHHQQNGELTIAELNLENADVIVVTKSKDESKRRAVNEFIDTLFSTREKSSWPKIHYSAEPFLVDQALWRDISVSPLPTERTAVRTREQTSKLENARRRIVRECVAVNIPLFAEIGDQLENAVSDSVHQGADPGNAIATEVGSLFAGRVLQKLSELDESNRLEPNTLQGQIVRIKGEFPLRQLGKQYGIDIYLSPTDDPEVLTVERQRITASYPQLAFYTRTGEQVPHWFSGIGIPVEFSLRTFERLEREYEAATRTSIERIRSGQEVPLRAEADALLELLESTFLDVEACNKKSGSNNPYKYSARVRDSIPICASNLVVNAFETALTSYLSYRVEVLENILGGISDGTCRESSKIGKTVFALALDLIVAERTHRGWLLSDQNLSENELLRGIKERIEKLKPGTAAVVHGLRNATEIRIRGESELTPKTRDAIVWACWYGSNENRTKKRLHEGYVDTAIEALRNAYRLAQEQGYIGWDKASFEALVALCRQNMRFDPMR